MPGPHWFHQQVLKRRGVSGLRKYSVSYQGCRFSDTDLRIWLAGKGRHTSKSSLKSETAGLSAVFPRRRRDCLLQLWLGLNNARSDEENQLLRCSLYRPMLEQVAKVRTVTEQRSLGDAKRVVGLDHAADDNRSTVSYQYLRRRLLCDQRRVAIDC